MNRGLDFVEEVFNGRTIGRILFHWQVYRHCRNLSGTIIDLASGSVHPSYANYLDIKPGKIIRMDYDASKHPDVIGDLNQPLPFEDNFADAVFLFNALYIFKKPADVLSEVRRIVKPGGRLFLTVPLIFSESKEPDDYWRFTSDGLRYLLEKATFREIEIYGFGERFSAAAYILHPTFRFNLIRLITYSLALLFDKLIPTKIKKLHPTPIGYFVIAQK